MPDKGSLGNPGTGEEGSSVTAFEEWVLRCLVGVYTIGDEVHGGHGAKGVVHVIKSCKCRDHSHCDMIGRADGHVS